MTILAVQSPQVHTGIVTPAKASIASSGIPPTPSPILILPSAPETRAAIGTIVGSSAHDQCIEPVGGVDSKMQTVSDEAAKAAAFTSKWLSCSRIPRRLSKKVVSHKKPLAFLGEYR